jgi:hypothetical protein
MENSVLEKKYTEAVRPYSEKELTLLRKRTLWKLRIGKVLIEHPDCKHFYMAKANGRKEKEALETGQKNVGNCSVCWKYRKTPNNLKNKASDLVIAFCDEFYNSPEVLTYDLYELEKDFYQWLYNEFNPVQTPV